MCVLMCVVLLLFDSCICSMFVFCLWRSFLMLSCVGLNVVGLR